MPALTWYVQRLRAMSAKEAAWRARSSLRDLIDRPLVTHRQRLRPLSVLINNSDEERCGYRVTENHVAQWTAQGSAGPDAGSFERLLDRADAIAAHRLSFLDIEDRYLGDPIDFNRDHGSGKASPMTFAAWIDYRDFQLTGDCKYVWEPSRQHQLVLLARAYRLSGQVRYARAVVEQLDSWFDQCPFGLGMQWRSGLEESIRLINWVWAVDMIRESSLVAGHFRTRLLNAVHRHVWEIARKYSRGSSCNNHAIGEAAGVFIAASYFSNLKGASRLRAEAHRLLHRQIIAQTFLDGGTREQSTSYHLFVLQLLLLSALVGRWTQMHFSAEYWERLEKMFEFLGVLTEGGERLPMIGDSDDGYVLELGENPRDVREWLPLGAVLFHRADFRRWAGRYSQTSRSLIGPGGAEQFQILTSPQGDRSITSRALVESGYYLLQSGAGAERISVVFDCGELGLAPLAAHAHADALSFTLRAFGVDVLVDPGTYDYFTYPKWRDYFRSTRAHNTIAIDGQDQSVMRGPFLWGPRAGACCLSWAPSVRGGTVAGKHDGYARLSDPVIHRRGIELDAVKRRIIVCDYIHAAARHEVEVCFHLSEYARTEQVDPRTFRADVGGGVVTITMDKRLVTEVLRGSNDPIAAWVSRAYHRKVPSTTLIGRTTSDGETPLICEIDISPPVRSFSAGG